MVWIARVCCYGPFILAGLVLCITFIVEYPIIGTVFFIWFASMMWLMEREIKSKEKQND